MKEIINLQVCISGLDSLKKDIIIIEKKTALKIKIADMEKRLVVAHA